MFDDTAFSTLAFSVDAWSFGIAAIAFMPLYLSIVSNENRIVVV